MERWRRVYSAGWRQGWFDPDAREGTLRQTSGDNATAAKDDHRTDGYKPEFMGKAAAGIGREQSRPVLTAAAAGIPRMGLRMRLFKRRRKIILLYTVLQDTYGRCRWPGGLPHSAG